MNAAAFVFFVGFILTFVVCIVLWTLSLVIGPQATAIIFIVAVLIGGAAALIEFVTTKRE